MKREGYGADYATTTTSPTPSAGRTTGPTALGRRKLYEPVERGFEREVRKRLDYWARLRAERGNGVLSPSPRTAPRACCTAAEAATVPRLAKAS